jgi:hypothetical protein
MLSSRENRFSWSKQGREREISFFRMMAAKWRPTVRKRDAQVDAKAKAASSKAKAAAAASKPVWTPWLLIE